MIYMQIRHGRFDSAYENINKIPLRKCKNLKQAAKKVRKLTAYNFPLNDDFLCLTDNVNKTFTVIEVVHG